MLTKPRHGQSCNGCGQCCLAELCPLGARVFKQHDGPCPALEANADGARICGLVVNPQSYAPFRTHAHGRLRMIEAALLLIGSGQGCDAQIEGEEADHQYRARLIALADKHRAKIDRAKTLWGVA